MEKKEIKTVVKRILAVLCVVALVVGLYPTQLLVKAETAESDYTTLTFSDFFGPTNKKVSCVSGTDQYSMTGTYSDSLHNLKIEGYYNFSAKEGAFVCFGGQNTTGSIYLGAWGDRDGTERIMLGRAGANMSPFNSGVYEGQSVALKLSEYNAAASTAGSKQLDSFYGEDLKISIAFAFEEPTSNSTTLSIEIWVDDVYKVPLTIPNMDATASYFEGTVCAKSVSSTMTLTSIEKEYLTFTDFFGSENAEVTYDSTSSVASDYGKHSDSLHNLRVEGYCNFSKNEAQTNFIYFGRENDSGGAIYLGAWGNGTDISRLMLGRAGENMFPFNSGEYVDQYVALLLSGGYNVAANAAGVETLSSFYGQDLKIAIEFSFLDPTSTSTDLRIMLTVNDVYRVTMKISGMDATAFEGSMGVVSNGNPITLTSIVEESPYTQNLTFTDFNGYDDYMVFEGKGTEAAKVDELRSKKDETIHGCLFEGYMNFGSGKETNRMWFGPSEVGAWQGFAIENTTSTDLKFTLYNSKSVMTFADGTTSFTLTPALYNEAVADTTQHLETLIGEDLKVSVGFLYEDETAESTTLTIEITINDVYKQELKVINTSSSDMKCSIAAQSKGPKFVIKTSPYRHLTFTDFGFDRVVHKDQNGSETKAYTDSLHNLEIEGLYNFGASTAAKSYVAFGGNKNGALFLTPWGEGELMFALADAGVTNVNKKGYYTENQFQKLKLSDYNSKAGDGALESFYGTDLNIKIRFVYDDPDAESTNLKVVITINDVFEVEQTMNGVAPLPGTIEIGSFTKDGGTPITVTSTGPDMTEISLQKDLLIAPGKYDSDDDSYTTDNDVAPYLGHYLDYDASTESAIEKPVLNTTLTQKVTFSAHANTYLYFAGTSHTSGVKFATQSDGSIKILASNGEFVGEYFLTEAFAGATLIGEEIELTLKLYEDGANAKLEVYINGQLYKNRPFVLTGAADEFGSYVGFSVTNVDGYIQIGNEADAEFYNLAYGVDEDNVGRYVFSYTGRGIVNGRKVAGDYYGDSMITEPGDYWFSGDATRAFDEDYTKRVILYYYGDAHVDGQMDVRDIIGVKKAEAGLELTTWSAEKSADANGDGTVNATDAESVRKYVLESSAVQKVKDSAVYFDSSDVMPIVGYNGPYRCTFNDTAYDFLTDNVYQAIKDVGVNTILTTGAYYAEADTTTSEEEKEKIKEQQQQIFTGLELAEKYNLNVLVRDTRIGCSGNEEIDDERACDFLKIFAKYSSFKGYNIVDEPYTDYYHYENTTPAFMLDDYAKKSEMGNKYANTLGYVNLLRINEKLNQQDGKTVLETYDRYLEDYINTHKPKLLSFDYYPFISDTNISEESDKGNDREASYLKNLSVISEKASDYKIPFWSYIQVGDNYNDNMNQGKDSTIENNPSKGELLWNVNTSLAYGAKGIAYFTLIQPPVHSVLADNNTNDYLRNGLIGAGAGLADKNVEDYKTEWYSYAANANKQVAEVDEVLMHATCKEVLAVGSEAQNKTGINQVTDSAGILESVSADNGAIIGVFEYQGKTAFYVVNHDMASEQIITLTFKEEKDYIISSKQATSTTTEEQSCTVVLEAGGAALICEK